MPAARPFSMLRTTNQWRRVVHSGTAIDADGGGVQLRWRADEASTTLAAEVPEPAGLAFDSGCRLYRSVPEEDRVERHTRVNTDLRTRAELPDPVDYLPLRPDPTAGDFEAADESPMAGRPQALAIDDDDLLFVVEADTASVAIYDLWNDRLLRRVTFLGPGGADLTPVDVAVHERTAWVLTSEGQLFRMEARCGPAPEREPPAESGLGGAAPFRLAVAPDGLVAVLYRAPDGAAEVVFPGSDVPSLAVPGATDLTFLTDDHLVVARGAGEDFRAYRYLEGVFIEDTPMLARGYDGRGIVTTPDGQAGFWAGDALRVTVAARVRFDREGHATTYRLDSGEYHQLWGRIFLDACAPEGTALAVSFVTTDDDTEDEPPIEAATPVEADLSKDPRTPPQLPALLEPITDHPIHRRETGREIPWKRLAAGDPFETYETAIHAGPGRYLWLRLQLSGNTRLTPRVRAIRAEHRGHDLLRRLPRVFSRETPVAQFLQRYLAMFDGVLTEMEGRAVLRHVLLDPQATPAELLPWLSSFVGLVQDERWPLPARRTLAAEAAELFKRRGTIGSLARMLEIYLGVAVIVLEHFRLRGLGGPLLGDSSGTPFTNSVLGAGLRVGGQIGTPGDQALVGTVEQAFDDHAHRFSVLVPLALTNEQSDVVDHVLDVHRPAHTLVEVCGLDRGLRVGSGLHVGMSSMIGHSGGFFPYQLGDSVLGRDSIVGRPDRGSEPEGTGP